MAVIDLNELIPSLVAQVSSPGQPLYEGVAEDDWLTYLLNGFYNAQLEGLLQGWSASEEGLVRESNGGTKTLTRDQQQIAVIYAAMDIVRNELRQLKSTFRAKAGPVEYETQQHATVLKTILDQLLSQKEIILDRLADSGGLSPSFYIDGVIARDYSINNGLTTWVGS
jgi:hypothetical protein